MALTAAERKQRSRERARDRRQAPGIAARAADPAVPDEALTPLERGVREFRTRVLDDLGGPAGLPLARLLAVETLATRWLIQGFLTVEILDLGKSGRLVDRRAVRARPLLADWLASTAAYERALAVTGFDPLDLPDPGKSLAGIVGEIVAARPPQPSSPQAPPKDPAPAEIVAPTRQGAPAVAQERATPRPPAEPVEVRPKSLVPPKPEPVVDLVGEF